MGKVYSFFLAMNITNDARKRAQLLHYVGEHTHEIYEANKTETEPDEGEKYKTAKTDLTKVFIPKKNKLVAEHEFTAWRQKESQAFDEYITELRQLVDTVRLQIQMIASDHNRSLTANWKEFSENQINTQA